MSWGDRLRGWFDAPASVDETRWVVLDVETSGLDAQRDQLLAIAAIAVQVDWPARRLSITPGDSFELVLRQSEVASARDNILLHGIGLQRQREGEPMPDGLRAFARFVGSSPLLAFHAPFDQAMIGRFVLEHLGAALPNRWVDIEQLCAVTHEKVRARALDEWLAHFSIVCANRHQAAADTLAECELLLRIWPQMAGQCTCWRDVEKLAAQQRWIARA
ncbi:MAG: 3'-5' exonuclease [Polaromonas sp.]|uniref:3'-5' exonuclease n=1 Tax=Polaromonas sp. TaxID=1869339 RepID=UPI002734C41B|nr:3'-5' exonuclease [Polaromonas sp.]MDP2819967.1 3'-5' exonuclease [Polaromonas sp.]